jgi:hypothetical protein
MKYSKTSLFLTAFAVALSCIVPEVALADCGKMVIYVYHFPRPPRRPRPPISQCPPTFPLPQDGMPTIPNYGQNPQQLQEQQQQLNNANNSSNTLNLNLNSGNGTGTVEPPPPVSGGEVAYGATFSESAQQAVIAWNGKSDDSGEETLILTTNEKSQTGKNMAMLSVLPLPGQPLSVDRASAKVFVQTKILLDKKIVEKRQREGKGSGGAGNFGAVLTKKIGSHNIFVWELDNIQTFKEEVTAYVAEKYNNGATALITDEYLQTIKKYFDRGFRYFAFDLTEVRAENTTKEAIAYRFKSKFAYYPLAISAIGGTGAGLVDLIVMTPGQINLRGAFTKDKEQSKISVLGNTSVNFTLDEVKKLDPKLAAVFGNLSEVTVRNFMTSTKNIGTYTDDFIAVEAK